jgi:hypothetical protein
MTEKQAYAAMFYFLKENWKRNNSVQVGAILGLMSLLQDGKPADPAMWPEWQRAVEYALAGGDAERLLFTDSNE